MLSAWHLDETPAGLQMLQHHLPSFPKGIGYPCEGGTFQVPSSEGFTGLAATLIKTCPGRNIELKPLFGLIGQGWWTVQTNNP